MATIKSYTDISQSKKLAEILPFKSADMIYTMVNGRCTPFIRIETIEEMDEDDVLCWTLAALLGILPEGTRLLKSTNISSIGDVKYHCDCPKVSIDKWFDNPVDACVDMIMRLNELKML